MRLFVHEAVKIVLQRFVLSIVEHKQSFNRCQFPTPIILMFVYSFETFEFLHQEMYKPSFLPACRVLLSQRVSSANLPRSPTCSTCSARWDRSCSTLEPTSSAPPSVSLWSKPLHDGFGAAAVRPDFNFERSCSLVVQQEFRVQRFNAIFGDRLGLWLGWG